MENNKKIELNDDQLDEVAGGRTEFNFGSVAAQADTVPTMLPILLHPDAMLEEDADTRMISDLLGRL